MTYQGSNQFGDNMVLYTSHDTTYALFNGIKYRVTSISNQFYVASCSNCMVPIMFNLNINPYPQLPDSFVMVYHENHTRNCIHKNSSKIYPKTELFALEPTNIKGEVGMDIPTLEVKLEPNNIKMEIDMEVPLEMQVDPINIKIEEEIAIYLDSSYFVNETIFVEDDQFLAFESELENYKTKFTNEIFCSHVTLNASGSVMTEIDIFLTLGNGTTKSYVQQQIYNCVLDLQRNPSMFMLKYDKNIAYNPKSKLFDLYPRQWSMNLDLPSLEILFNILLYIYYHSNTKFVIRDFLYWLRKILRKLGRSMHSWIIFLMNWLLLVLRNLNISRIDVLLLPLSRANLLGNITILKNNEPFTKLKLKRFDVLPLSTTNQHQLSFRSKNPIDYILSVESLSHVNNCTSWFKNLNANSIVIASSGDPCNGSLILLKKVLKECNATKLLLLYDFDLSGISILSKFLIGSKNNAGINQFLTFKNAIRIGLSLKHVIKLEKKFREKKMSDYKKRCEITNVKVSKTYVKDIESTYYLSEKLSDDKIKAIKQNLEYI